MLHYARLVTLLCLGMLAAVMASSSAYAMSHNAHGGMHYHDMAEDVLATAESTRGAVKVAMHLIEPTMLHQRMAMPCPMMTRSHEQCAECQDEPVASATTINFRVGVVLKIWRPISPLPDLITLSSSSEFKRLDRRRRSSLHQFVFGYGCDGALLTTSRLRI